MEDGTTMETETPTYAVGRLGVRVRPTTMPSDLVTRLRLDEIERRILAIEERLENLP